MKLRIVLNIILLLIIGLVGALIILPEFRVWWENTPVLSNIYSWCEQYLNALIYAVLEDEKRFFYISIIGVVVVSIIVFGIFTVRKIKSEDEKRIEVAATPVINNKGSKTVIVIEEN